MKVKLQGKQSDLSPLLSDYQNCIYLGWGIHPGGRFGGISIFFTSVKISSIERDTHHVAEIDQSDQQYVLRNHEKSIGTEKFFTWETIFTTIDFVKMKET